MRRKTIKVALSIIALMLGPCVRGQQSTPAADSFKPELVLQTGQNTAATSVAFSNDGRLIASGGYYDISIHVWETATGRQLRVLSKHGNTSSPYFSGVTAIALSRDGKFVAGGFKDNSVTIWDLNSGEELAEMATSIALPAMALLAIQFSPDGKYLLTAYAEGTTTLWDLSTGNKIREIKNGVYGATCNSATFTADGREVVSISGAVPAVVVKRGDAGAKTHVVSMDVLTGKETPVVDLPELLPGKAMGRCFVTSTTDGRILVSTSTSEAEKIWDVGSKSEPRILLHATPERVSSHTLSPSGQIAAFAQHAKLYVWDLTRSAQIYAVSIEANKTFEQGNEISSLEFSSAADRLAVGTFDGRISIFEASSGRLARKLEGSVNVPRSIVFDSHGHRLYSRNNTAWNLDSGQAEKIMDQAVDGNQLFSAGGEMLAVNSPNDGDVRIWNVAKNQVVATLSPKSESLINRMAFSPDGKFLAVTYRASAAQLQEMGAGGVKITRDANVNFNQIRDTYVQIRIWEIASGKEIGDLPSTASGNLDFSPDGQSLAVAAVAGIEIWDVTTRTKKQVLQPSVPTLPGGGLFNDMVNRISSLGRVILSVRYSPDGRFIAAGIQDSSRSMSEIAEAAQQRFSTLPHRKRSKVNLFGLGQPQLPGGNGNQTGVLKSSAPVSAMSIKVRGPVEVWDSSNGQRVLNLPGHPSGAGLVVFSPNGKLLATAGTEDDIKLWDMSNGKELRTLSGHTGMIGGMAFSPDNQLLATASADGTTRLWDTGTGEPMATLLSLNDGRDWLVITPDGLFDGSPAAWNQILWRFADNIFDVVPVEIFFNEYYYPDLLTDLLAGKHPHAKQDIAKKDRRQPQIRLESPASLGNTTASANIPVKVHVDAAPAGAQDLRLFRNGSLVKIWRGDVLAGKKEITLEATVPIVAGLNRLSAYAFNSDNIKSEDAFLDVTGAESLRRHPVAYILAVGINAYANSDYNLHFAGADAQGFSDELKRQLSKQGRFERLDVTVLSDQNATKTNILKAIEDLAERVQPEDEVLIFIASHGTAAQDHFFLIPHDLGYKGNRNQLDEQAVSTILQHSISDQDLEKAFAPLDAGRILLVIDACNSGQALETEEKRRGPMNSKGLAQLAYEKGMYILTASQSYQAAQEVSRIGHGLLTYALVVEGLEKGMADFEPRDGTVVIREWLDYASSRVPQIELEELRQAQALGRSLSFGDGSRTRAIGSVPDTSEMTQHPKLFYRRELEGTTWVISTPQ